MGEGENVIAIAASPWPRPDAWRILHGSRPGVRSPACFLVQGGNVLGDDADALTRRLRRAARGRSVLELELDRHRHHDVNRLAVEQRWREPPLLHGIHGRTGQVGMHLR